MPGWLNIILAILPFLKNAIDTGRGGGKEPEMPTRTYKSTGTSTPPTTNVNIAQSLLGQMGKAGQPRTTTTTLEQPEEKLNMMNLGMIAMMLLEDMLGKKKTPATESDFTQFLKYGNPSSITPENNPAALNPIAGIQPIASNNYGSMNPMNLFKMLLG